MEDRGAWGDTVHEVAKIQCDLVTEQKQADSSQSNNMLYFLLDPHLLIVCSLSVKRSEVAQ